MESYSPLAVFAFVSSITPGPNNMMLSASGLAFGFRRTIPHIVGVWFGFVLLLITCALGLGVLVVQFPVVGVALKVVGSFYLLYLAWTLRRALHPAESRRSKRPLRFQEAAAFQFINPKAWVMGATAIAVFGSNSEPVWLATASVCAVFSIVGVPCICSWAALGASIRPWLVCQKKRQVFSVCLTLLMIYAIVAMWV